MAISTGARSLVSYVTEVTWGTTPVTPAMAAIPFTSFSVNLTKSIHDDLSVQGDRMERFSIHGNKTVAGSLEANLSDNNFDVLLESACNSTFTADVLKTGTTRKSFTIEQASSDITQYTVYTGIVVNSCDIKVPVNGIVTASFDLLGKNMTISGTPLDASVTAPTLVSPFHHDAGVIKENGVSVAMITGIDLKIDNGYTANHALGSTLAADVTYGFATITGTVTAYFEDAVLINKFVNGTASSIQFTLTDGVNTLDVTLPNVKYSGATKTVAGQGATILTLPFKALYDGTALSNIVITRA